MSGRGRSTVRRGRETSGDAAADKPQRRTLRGHTAATPPAIAPTLTSRTRGRTQEQHAATPAPTPAPSAAKRGRPASQGQNRINESLSPSPSPAKRGRGSARGRGRSTAASSGHRHSTDSPSRPSPAVVSGRGLGRGGGHGRGGSTLAVGNGSEEGVVVGTGAEADHTESEPSGVSAVRGYFSCKGRPSKSSSSVAELNLPALGEGRDFQDLLDAVPIKHFNQVESLRVEHSKAFQRWRFMLKEGFSLLLYGFGSKRRLLEDFAQSTLTDGGVLMVNGFIPTTKAKEVLDNAASMLLRATTGASKRGDARELLSKLRRVSVTPARRLYIVIHNIDGPTLRGAESQRLLSQLAECPAISLVASMDHVDTPLLWDKGMSNRFNWIWQDATTYAPYMAEAALMPSLLLGRKSEQTGKGAVMVLMSLTAKARRVFRVLADNQNVSQGNNKEQGGGCT